MRITIATGPLLPVPPVQGGAMARIWQGLGEAFAGRGHTVVIVARAYPAQPATERRHGVRYTRAGGFFQSTSLWFDLARDWVYALRTAPRLPAADVLVTNDFWLPILAGCFQGRAGRIVISANRHPKRQYGLYQRAAAIVAPTQAIRDAIAAQTPGAAHRTLVIPNPIDTTIFHDHGRPERPEANRLLYVGRLHPEKGVHLLLEAFARLVSKEPGLELTIAGPHRPSQGGGGDAYLARLRRLAGGWPVEFLGPVFDVERLAALYRDADVFSYPSLAEHGEAMPVAPLEAMACGTLPVVSSLACFRDLIHDRVSGLFFNHRAADPAAALAERLLEAFHTPQSSMLRRNAAFAAARCALPAIAERWLALSERLDSDRGSGLSSQLKVEAASRRSRSPSRSGAQASVLPLSLELPCPRSLTISPSSP